MTGLPSTFRSIRRAAAGVEKTAPEPAAPASSGEAHPGATGKVVCSAVLFVAAVAYLVLGAKYALLTSGGDVGPGFLPRIIAVALVVTTAWSLVVDVRRRGDASREHGRLRDVIVMSALLVGYVVLTVVIGSVLAGPVFIYATLALFNCGRWRQNVLVSVGVSAVLYGLLVLWLDAPVSGGLLDLVP